MSTSLSFLAALQLADTALPIGRFVHSYGLESWLARHQEADEAAIADLATTYVRDVVATLDGAAVAHAYRAAGLVEVLTLDRLLTAHKLGTPAREASHTCGRRLAVLSVDLSDAPLVRQTAAHVRSRTTDGNLAVIAGVLAGAVGLTVTEAVLVELRGAVAGLLSAAVRLGRLAPTRAQVLHVRLAPTVSDAAEEAVALRLDELRSTAPDLEIAALAHRRAHGRSFAT